MFKQIRGLFSHDLSIDLGTANTLIYAQDKGIVLNEPSVVAIRNTGNNQKNVIAVGTDAKSMLGRTPGDITAIRPLRDGVIADFQVTERMLQHFIRKVYQNRFIKPSPRILVCVPCQSTEVERRAIKESALSAGARDVILIEEPMAAAIGAGMPVHEAVGTLVVDIGGGTTEVAVLALNGVVVSQTIRVGGDRFDETIVTHVRKTRGCVIGDFTSEQIKHDIGAALADYDATAKTMEVRGRHVAEGVPKTFTLTSDEINKALQEPLSTIIQGIKSVLELTPPELASDIAETGMVLTGGGSLLRGLDELISKETGVAVIVAEEPLTCVVRGGGKVLEMLGKSDGIFIK